MAALAGQAAMRRSQQLLASGTVVEEREAVAGNKQEVLLSLLDSLS